MDSQQNAEQQALVTQIYSRARRTTSDLVTEIEAVAAAVDAIPAPVTDHGLLSGLGDNDHPQYLLTADAGALATLDTVGTPEISDLSVTPAKLSAAVQADIDGKADAAHTHTLADVTDSGALAALNTVGTAQIDNGAVTNLKLGSGSVTAGILATSAVETLKIAASAVTSAKLATDAVLAANISSGAVVGGKIGPGAVETTNIADNAVLSAKIADTAVTSAKLSAAVQADIDAQSLADNDQTLSGNRTISNAGGAQFLYTLLTDTSGPTKTASHIVQPNIPRNVLAASETGVSSTTLTVAKDTIDLGFSAGADLRLNTDQGVAGDVVTSGGPGNPPVYAPGIVHSATAPDTSQLWYHTTDNCLYQYDSTRSKWLSIHEEQYHFAISATTTANHILRQEGNLTAFVSDGRGRGIMHDITVTGWVWHVRGGGTSGRDTNLQKEDEAGTYIFNYYTSTPAGTWTVSRETDLNHDYDATDRIGVILYSGASAQDPRCSVTYRRRPS